MVKYNGEYKVAQYGQWDGYPSGQGLTALRFCRDESKLASLKSSLVKLRFFTKSEATEWNRLVDENDEKVLKYHARMLSRDLGADILQQIIDAHDLEQIWLDDDYKFLQDSLFCEWAYCVNFDTNRLEVYQSGDNKIAEFDLNNLPSDDEFLATFKDGDDDED